MRLLSALAVAVVLSSCQGQNNAEKRAKEKLKQAEAEKAEKKKKDAEAETKRDKPKEDVKLGSPWDDGKPLVADGACPPGLWSLFKGDTPGEDKAEKAANEAKRGELAKELKAETFMVKLRAPDQVKLGAFDTTKGQFPLEVQGSIDCDDSFGHVTIAWTAAKAGTPPNSAAKQDAEVTQNLWMAPPITFAIPMKISEQKEWKEKNQIGLSARAVFKLGKVEVDHKMHKVAKVAEKVGGETISLGGGNEDWGAGRLVRAELVGVRVATNHEKDQIFEKKGDSPP